jgi:AGZA family xanthine/uracil permease-like MFS transporter
MLKDIVIALFGQLDVIGGALIAVSYGFFLAPSALGYLIGLAGLIATPNLTPVSFMYENMALSHHLGKTFDQRISMIVLAGFFTGLLGLFGLPQYLVQNIGQGIFNSVMAGVGLYLAKVGWEISQKDILVGLPCFFSAIMTYLITLDLVSTISVSLGLGLIIRLGLIYSDRYPIIPLPRPSLSSQFKFIRPRLDIHTFIGAIALSTLTIGGNIAYVAINAQIANHPAIEYNSSTVISGLADLGSSLFSGANVELIVSPTAAAPNPKLSAILFLLIAVIILSSGVIYRLIPYLPVSAVGGYLFVIGALLITPPNLANALKLTSPQIAGLTLGITFITNPFYGLMAGILAGILV